MFEEAEVPDKERKFDRSLPIYLRLVERRPRDAKLLFHIAALYQKGLGTARDPAEGNRWMERSAQTGYPKAQFYLSGVRAAEERMNEAVSLLELAAYQGYAPALYHLGRMYELGTYGVRPDLSKAYSLYHKVAESGHFCSERNLQ